MPLKDSPLQSIFRDVDPLTPEEREDIWETITQAAESELAYLQRHHPEYAKEHEEFLIRGKQSKRS